MSGGYVLRWDDTITVGDVVTAYHAGFHRVTQVVPRPGFAPVIHYKTICKTDGTRVKGNVERSCCCSHAQLAHQSINEEIAKLNATIARLEQLNASL